METVIYAKFSNERSRRFAIRTDILEDSQGRRRVRKEALYPEGREHVESLLRWYALFSEQCRGTRLCYNRCKRVPGGVELEYLEGISMEDYLERLEREQGVPAMASMFLDYLKRLRTFHDLQDFQETEGFREVFGAFEADAKALKLRCAPATNIDLICGNILLSGEGAAVIDYEWSFDFPIPLNYLLYRNIFYFRDHAGRAYLGGYDFFQELGITREEIRAYDKMEERLQKYVCGEHIPVRDLYESISPGTVPLELSRYQDSVQIYPDRGRGLREEESLRFPIKRGECRIRLALDGEVRGLRIDPGSLPALVEIRRLVLSRIQGEAWIPAAEGAGCLKVQEGMLAGAYAFFEQRDPKLFLENPPEGDWGLELTLTVWAGEETPLSVLRGWFRELEGREEALKAKIRSMEVQAEAQTEEMRRMQNTKVWRAYQKYRDMVERKQE